MDLSEILKDPRLVELLKKAFKELNTIFIHGQGFCEEVSNILNHLEKHNSSTTQDPIAYEPEDVVLKLSQEELDKIDRGHERDILIDIISKHYQKVRPKSWVVSRSSESDKVVFEEKGYYKRREVGQALGLAPAYIDSLISTNLIFSENGLISGYEVLRLHHRHDRRRSMEEQDFLTKFYLGPEIFEKLVDLEVIEVFTRNDSRVVLGNSVGNFYDVVFPIRGFRDSNRSRKVVDTFTENFVPENIPQNLVTFGDKKSSNEYIPTSRVPFKVDEDYFLITDAETQDKDASRIRYVNLGSSEDDIRLNPSDVNRLYLAKAYLPENRITELLKLQDIEYDRASVIRTLRLVGLPPILDKDKLGFPPATVDIVTLVDEDLQRILNLAGPFIKRYGHYISLGQIVELLERDITIEEFFDVKTSRGIDHIKIREDTKYTTLQVVKAYEEELSETH